MRIDLFEFVEGLIRGIIYFLYNVVETTCAILINPIKGPVSLYRSHGSSAKKQIGGLTYLLLLFLIIFFLFLRLISTEHKFFPSLMDTVLLLEKVPQIDTNWPVILAALVSTIIVDAVLRFTLRILLPVRARRRHLALASAEYASLWIFLGCLAVAMPFTSKKFFVILTPRSIGALLAEIAIISLIVIIASIPAAIILRRATTTSTQRRAAKYIPVVTWAISIAGLFGIASFLGAWVAAGIQMNRENQDEDPIIVETLKCTSIPDDRVETYGLVWSKGNRPFAASPEDFGLVIGNPRGGVFAEQPVWADENAEKYLVISDQAKVVHLKFRRSTGAEGACSLTWHLGLDGNWIPIGNGRPPTNDGEPIER